MKSMGIGRNNLLISNVVCIVWLVRRIFKYTEHYFIYLFLGDKGKMDKVLNESLHES